MLSLIPVTLRTDIPQLIPKSQGPRRGGLMEVVVVGGGGGGELVLPPHFLPVQNKKNVCQKFLVTFMVENKEDTSKKLYSSFMLVVTLFV